MTGSVKSKFFGKLYFPTIEIHLCGSHDGNLHEMPGNNSSVAPKDYHDVCGFSDHAYDGGEPVSRYSIDYGVLMLGVLICSLPTGILFLILQRSFTNGILGAVKG